MKLARKGLSKIQTADLIERFLREELLYPQEWNDFVETSQKDKEVESYRKICLSLDPLVNAEQPQDVNALDRLRSLIAELRSSYPK